MLCQPSCAFRRCVRCGRTRFKTRVGSARLRPPSSAPTSLAARHSTASSASDRRRRQRAAGALIRAAIVRAFVPSSASPPPGLPPSTSLLSDPPSFAWASSARVATNPSPLVDWLSHDFSRVVSPSPCAAPSTLWLHRTVPAKPQNIPVASPTSWAAVCSSGAHQPRQRILLRRATDMCSGPHHPYCLRKNGESHRHDGARRPSILILKGLLKAHLLVIVWGVNIGIGHTKHTLKVKKE